MHEFIRDFPCDGPDPLIAIKDTIDIEGFPTTAGSRALMNASPAKQHAKVVELILAAGWQISGKTNMHELAFGMTGINEYFGTPTNPQDERLIPGGSSSGSAAAVGLCLADAALGTDTGGSIRGPAACCGVIGFKPTFGRVDRRGVAPNETTLDCLGPFAREMRVVTDVMAVIAPTFNANMAHEALHVCHVGVVTVDAEPEIVEAVWSAPKAAGFSQRAIDLPGFQSAFLAGLTIINAETWRAFGHLVETQLLGLDVTNRLIAAASTTHVQIAAAEQIREVFSAAVDRALEEVDVLILPTLPTLPITLAQARNGTPVISMSSLIRPFNLSGHPALSLPMSIKGSRLKAGLQIVGRKGADEQVCAIAASFEQALAR